MVDEYIRKADVLNLPQSIERNLRGEIVERSIDVKDIEALKPADVVQVVHGRWEYTRHYGARYRKCSVCSAEKKDDRSTGWNFCSYCGAKME